MENSDVSVAKWGNSLAVRIPADVARRAGIRVGDRLEARLTIDGGLSLRPAHWDRSAFLRELQDARDAMPAGASVMDEVRRGGAY